MGASRRGAGLQPQIGEKSNYQGEISNLGDSVPLGDLVGPKGEERQSLSEVAGGKSWFYARGHPQCCAVLFHHLT